MDVGISVAGNIRRRDRETQLVVLVLFINKRLRRDPQVYSVIDRYPGYKPELIPVIDECDV